MRCQFFHTQIHFYIPNDPPDTLYVIKMKDGQMGGTLIGNHATSCKIFGVMQRTPEICFEPKFHQN